MADTLNTPLRTALDGQLTPKFLATLNTNGEPNCVPVITIHPYHDGTLVFGEFLMQKTRANLGVCDTVSVAVLDDTFTGWSIKGRFRGFETRGERLDFVNTLPLLRYNAYTAPRGRHDRDHRGLVRHLHEQTQRAEQLSPCAGRCGVQFPQRRPCMPLQVAEKFRRMGPSAPPPAATATAFPAHFPSWPVSRRATIDWSCAIPSRMPVSTA